MIYHCKFSNCSLVFNRPSKLKRHEENHAGIKSYVCSEVGCKKSYSSPSHLKRHIITYHSSSVKSDVRYVCSYPHCDADFSSVAGRRKHEKKHVYSHYCDRCNRYFLKCHSAWHEKNDRLRMEKLKKLRGEITPDSLYICEDCHLSFPSDFLLKLHCKTSHKPFSVPFLCGEANCSKSFRQKRNLKTHILRNHLNVTVFFCGESGCRRIFRHMKNLKSHIITKHLNVTYQCPIEKCHRSFYFKKSLRHHIQQHEENTIESAEKKVRNKKEVVDLAQHISFSLANIIE